MLTYIFILCSKAEIFIHVAIHNLTTYTLLIMHVTTYLSYTELRITAGQKTISE